MEKILVIDDEKPTLNMFRLTLKAYGYSVLTAENGNEGLAVFDAERPQIVLTDIKMPGMDGIEVLRRIKNIDPQTEVIVITGHGDMDLAIKALNLDATDFINKPIQRALLDQALKRARERLQIRKRKEDEVSVQSSDHAALIHVRGNLTSQSEPYLLDAYKSALSMGKAKVVLCFEDNTSINGAGLAILTQLLLEAKKSGLSVAMTGISENFRKVFEIVGISKLVPIFDSLEEALK